MRKVIRDGREVARYRRHLLDDGAPATIEIDGRKAVLCAVRDVVEIEYAYVHASPQPAFDEALDVLYRRADEPCTCADGSVVLCPACSAASVLNDMAEQARAALR